MAFRDAETLDFTAQDIFVLTGPTGSGKSSILDAMSFELQKRYFPAMME